MQSILAKLEVEIQNSLEVDINLIRIEAFYWKAEYDRSLELCAECKNLSDKDKNALILYWEGRNLIAMSKYADAATPLSEALEIASRNKNYIKLKTRCLIQIASLHKYLPVEKAEKSAQEALTIARKNGFSDLEIAALLRQSWIILSWKDQISPALELASQALTIAQKLNFCYQEAKCHHLLAVIYKKQKTGVKALKHNQKFVELANKTGLPRLHHTALCSMAIAHREYQENWLKSLKAIREAYKISEKFNFQASGDVFDVWFNVSFGLGKWNESVNVQKVFEKSLNMSYPRGCGFYYIRQGHLAYSEGDFTKAIEYYNEAIDKFREYSTDERDYRRVQPYLGMALIGSKDIGQALNLLEDACKYWENRNSSKFALCLFVLGRATLLQNDLSKAKKLINTALKCAGFTEGAWPIKPMLLIEMAEVMFREKDLKNAQKFAYQGYMLLNNWKHFLAAEGAFTLGKILLAKKKKKETIELLKQSKAKWTKLNLLHKLNELNQFAQRYNLKF